MANIGEINVGMSLDAEDFGKGLDYARHDVRTFAGDLDRVGKLAKGFLVGSTVMRGANFLVSIAKDAAAAEEGVNSLAFIFGSKAATIEAFSRSMAGEFNVGLNTMLDASGRLGSMFQGADLDPGTVAKYTKDIGKLAVDYSRFKNTSVGTSLDKMISGLSGEAEPLRAFGIFLDEGAVKAKALELGLGDLNGELTAGEKITARYALIMEKGAAAMGTAEREAAGAAAKIEGLTGAWENFQIALGKEATPVVGTVFGGLSDVLNYGRKMIEGQEIPLFAGLDADKLLGDAVKSTLVDLKADLLKAWPKTAEQMRRDWADLTKQANRMIDQQTMDRRVGDFKASLQRRPSWMTDDLVKADKPDRQPEGFSAASPVGSRDWASAILRSRFGGGGKDPVADNTKATAEGVNKLIAGVSIMTGKLEALTTDKAPDWK